MQNRKGLWHMLKKLAMLAVFSIPVFLGTVANADEIHLKDGNVLRVKRYQEKDGQVIFNLESNGQLYSMDKALVKEIKRSGKASKKFKEPER